MMRTPRHVVWKLAPMLMGAAALSGCISLTAKPPSSLLTLDSTATVPSGQTANSARSRTISIAVPTVAQEIAVTRVPVRTGTSLAYLKDAQWVDAPARMFTRVLGDTISVRTGRVVLNLRQSMADPGARLSGELRQFGVDAATQQAVVVFDATLIRDQPAAAPTTRATPSFERRRFEARVPLAVVAPAETGLALNAAANQVANDVADWVGK